MPITLPETIATPSEHLHIGATPSEDDLVKAAHDLLSTEADNGSAFSTPVATNNVVFFKDVLEKDAADGEEDITSTLEKYAATDEGKEILGEINVYGRLLAHVKAAEAKGDAVLIKAAEDDMAEFLIERGVLVAK